MTTENQTSAEGEEYPGWQIAGYAALIDYPDAWDQDQFPLLETAVRYHLAHAKLPKTGQPVAETDPVGLRTAIIALRDKARARFRASSSPGYKLHDLYSMELDAILANSTRSLCDEVQKLLDLLDNLNVAVGIKETLRGNLESIVAQHETWVAREAAKVGEWTHLVEGAAIPAPKNEAQAAAMVQIGESWLRNNAPHRLKQPPIPSAAEIEMASALQTILLMANRESLTSMAIIRDTAKAALAFKATSQGWVFKRNFDGSVGITAPLPKAGESQRMSDCIYARQSPDLHELLGKLADHQAAYNAGRIGETTGGNDA